MHTTLKKNGSKVISRKGSSNGKYVKIEIIAKSSDFAAHSVRSKKLGKSPLNNLDELQCTRVNIQDSLVG